MSDTTINPAAIVPKPVERKSWVQQFVERATSGIQKAEPASAVSYVREAGGTLGTYLEGGTTGSLLGAAHAKWGLDTKGGPIDGWLAGLGAILSVGLSGHFPGAAMHAREIGSQAFTIWSFRKSFELVAHEPFAATTQSPGSVSVAPTTGKSAIAGEDPIVKAAAGLP